MVAKKLNFEQPILSVRRNSLKVDERKIGNTLPVIPWLSPISGPVSNPGAVPFKWEHIPGRPKEQIKHEAENCDTRRLAARPPPGRYPRSGDNKVEAGLQTSRERRKHTTEERKNSDYGDCDEAFADGLDLRTESSLSSGRMSGLIGIDDLDANSSRRYSIDSQSREKKGTANQDKPAIWYRPRFVKSYCYYDNKEEKQESNNERDQRGNLVTVCCLLPCSLSKSSVCIIDPVPALSLRTRVTTFPSSRVQSRSLNHTRNERTVKQVDKIRTAERKEKNKASLKSCKTLQELLQAEEGSPKELDSRGCVEKIVHVDTVDKVNNTSSSDPSTKASRREVNNVIHSKRTHKMRVLDSSHQDFKKSNNVELEAEFLPSAHISEDLHITSSVNKSDRKSRSIVPKVVRGNEDSSHPESTSTRDIEVAEKKVVENVEKQLSRATTTGNSERMHSKVSVPPPLPRSPSDSWLRRTLPSMSTKKASAPSFVSRFSSKW